MLNRKPLSVVALLLFSILITSVAHGHKDGGIVIKDPWVREAPPVSPVLAGYMVIENHTGSTQELTAVTSSAFQKIEIHKTVFKDGMASMEGQNKLPVAAEGRVVLKPGGTHLMLINPAKRLKAGDSVSLVLQFASGKKAIVSVPVKKAASISHEHHGNSEQHADREKMHSHEH